MIKFSDFFAKHFNLYTYKVKSTHKKISSSLSNSKNIADFLNYINGRYDKLTKAHKARILEYNTNDQSLVILKDSPGHEERKDNFFQKRIVNGKLEVFKLPYYEALKGNILCLGGIDFDNLKTHQSLIEGVENLIELDSIKAKNEFGINIIAYESILSKTDRYNHLVKYSLDETHTPEHIIKFTKKYIMPILRRNANTNTDMPILTLFTFSAGGREVMMIENAFNNILKHEAGLDNDEIKNVCLRINAVCIGYACKFGEQVGNKNNIGRFKKIIYYAIEDSGVKLPEHLSKNTLDHKEVVFFKPFSFIMKRNQYILEKLDAAEVKIIFPTNTLEKQIKGKRDNEVGHAYPYYLQVIKEKLPKKHPKSLRSLLLFKNTNTNYAWNSSWQNKVLKNNSDERTI